MSASSRRSRYASSQHSGYAPSRRSRYNFCGHYTTKPVRQSDSTDVFNVWIITKSLFHWKEQPAKQVKPRMVSVWNQNLSEPAASHAPQRQRVILIPWKQSGKPSLRLFFKRNNSFAVIYYTINPPPYKRRLSIFFSFLLLFCSRRLSYFAAGIWVVLQPAFKLFCSRRLSYFAARFWVS